MAVKKKISGSPSVKAEVHVSGSTQSVESRQSAEAELSSLIAKFTPEHLGLIGELRRWLQERLPTAHQIVYEYRGCFVISYSPNDRGYEGILALRAGGSGVRLYFNRGKDLTDTQKLLQGSGKQTRWMSLDGASTLARPEVARLIDEAIASNPVPLAPDGSGSVVIRTSAPRPSESETTRLPPASRSSTPR